MNIFLIITVLASAFALSQCYPSYSRHDVGENEVAVTDFHYSLEYERIKFALFPVDG